MAVMHLRLEHPDAMTAAETPVKPSRDKTSRSDTSSGDAPSSSSGGDQSDEGVDASSEAAAAVEARKLSMDDTGEELYRVPSMNLATNPTVWVGDATLSLGAPGRRTSDGGGGINPFDSSSEEGDVEETAQAHVGGCGGDTKGGDLGASLEAPSRTSLALGNNPFDFSFFDSKDAAAGGEAVPCSRETATEGAPGGRTLAREVSPSEAAAFPTTATVTYGARSCRIGELLPAGQIVPATASTPRSAGVLSAATPEPAWPAAVDSSVPPDVDQLLLTSGIPSRVQQLDLASQSPSTVVASPPSPFDSFGASLTSSAANTPPLPFPPPATTTGAESGVAKAPRDKCLPPIPSLAFGAEGISSSPFPTPPVTPFTAGPAKTPADVRDRADVPSPSAGIEPEGLFPAFRDTTDAASPALNKEQVDLFLAFRDRTEVPTSILPSKSQKDLHLAFRANEAEASSPPKYLLAAPLPGSLRLEQPPQPALPEPHGLLDETDSTKRLQNFNPFGRPGSFVLCQTRTEEPAHLPEKVGQSLGSPHPTLNPPLPTVHMASA